MKHWSQRSRLLTHGAANRQAGPRLLPNTIAAPSQHLRPTFSGGETFRGQPARKAKTDQPCAGDSLGQYPLATFPCAAKNTRRGLGAWIAFRPFQGG